MCLRQDVVNLVGDRVAFGLEAHAFVLELLDFSEHPSAPVDRAMTDTGLTHLSLGVDDVEAARALGKIGPAAKEAIPVIKEVVDDTDDARIYSEPKAEVSLWPGFARLTFDG